MFALLLILLTCAVLATPAVALWHPPLRFWLRYLIGVLPAILNYAVFMLPAWLAPWLSCSGSSEYFDVCTVSGMDVSWLTRYNPAFLITLVFIAIPLSICLVLTTLSDQIALFKFGSRKSRT